MAGPTSFTKVDWARDFLTHIGAPVTPENLAAVVTWENAEGGHFVNNAHYNPLNTTLDAPGAKPINSVGVKAYPDYETGMNATVQTLASPNYGYPNVIAALRQGNSATTVLTAIGQSSWVGGNPANQAHYLQQLLSGLGNGRAEVDAPSSGDESSLLGQVNGELIPGIPDPGLSITSPLEAAKQALVYLTHAAAWVSDRRNWIRILEVIGGGLFILIGLSTLTRDIWGPAAKDAAAAAAVAA